ncbi:MAG: cytochrome c biogenesis protein CcsA [Candidatus Schekmanbacteria bacterium]|nr:cytochrome c biogenesis protein CcsA [Candidatus Schekmanbacteria bacterium]
MILLLSKWLSVLLYAASTGCYFRHLQRRKPRLGSWGTALFALALPVHFLALLQRGLLMDAVPYLDFYGSLSLFGWMLGLAYLLLELRRKNKAMSIFVLPIIIAFHLLFAIVPAPAVEQKSWAKGALFAFHVNVSMFAYAAFTLAFISSVTYLVLYRRLRKHRPGRWAPLLPPLRVLEETSRTSIRVGVVALAVGVATGIVRAAQVWTEEAQEIDAKVPISLACLVIYVTYLLLEGRRGWRGERSAWVSIAGFSAVLFSYTLGNLLLSRLHSFF